MKDTLSIALDKLTAWKSNVRKTNAKDGIAELAASIASHGLLQSLVVRKAGNGKYQVLAGRRRFLALQSLVKAGTLRKDQPIACTLADDNIQRPNSASLKTSSGRRCIQPIRERRSHSGDDSSGIGPPGRAAGHPWLPARGSSMTWRHWFRPLLRSSSASIPRMRYLICSGWSQKRRACAISRLRKIQR